MRCSCFSPAPIGRLRHVAGERLARHCHRHGFAAVVLAGGYVEAGDRGRRAVGPGDVLIHRPFDAHLNQVAARGAEVLILPFEAANDHAAFARTADPDGLTRLAETDPAAASRLLSETMVAVEEGAAEWPDLLAHALREQPQIRLADWASSVGLRPESVSRGFRLAYGVTPAGYRATARAQAAWRAVVSSSDPLAAIAHEAGFADQAHMTRAIARLTGQPPGRWRIAA